MDRVSELTGHAVSTLEKDRLTQEQPSLPQAGRLLRYRGRGVESVAFWCARRSTSEGAAESRAVRAFEVPSLRYRYHLIARK